ncbi:MAG: flagellin hook IN motif-containing protein [Woeseiaceae bacterium]
MAVIQNLQNLFGSIRIKPVSQAPLSFNPQRPVQDNSATDVRRARSQLLQLYKHLERLADLTDVNTRFKLDLPDARSSSGLGLDLTHTAATLNASEEVNASPMSFSPFGPEWDDGSSAAITLGGEYDGTHGSGTLSFEVRWDGTHGVDDLRIRFENQAGQRIRNINIRDHHAEDRQYNLQNGLYLTLGPGDLIDRDTTTFQVFDSVGAIVDPDKPLGGGRNSNPNLQFGLPAISNGSFQVNGESISVDTTDSINDVVNRINLSNAGVTANFNATLERIDFLQDTLGSVPTIDLQNDTSNFLEAVKLDTATVVPGIDPETIQSFADVSAFSGIVSGDILINDRQISIDTATDSLSSITDKINASSADVTATFDPESQEFLIEADDAASTLEIDSNGTGFFAALNMTEGRVDPEAVSRGISRRRSYDIADEFAAAFEDLNSLFTDKSFKDGAAHTSYFRAPLESAFKGVYGGSNSGSVFGVRYDGSAEARRFGRFADIDRRALTRNLQLRGEDVKNFLAGRDGNSGMLRELLGATRLALANVNEVLGVSGTFVDTFA